MWRRSSRPAGGFTLVEVLVVVASLGMILWMVGALFFPMRQAAERQRLQVEARQTARGATDYVAMLVRGATDLNDVTNPRNPAAILTFLYQSAPGTSGTNPTCDGSVTITSATGTGCVQVSYNNVTSAALATPGTDILTLGVASAPLRLTPSLWPVPGTANDGQQNAWEFSQGCPSDAANLAAFELATGHDSVTGWSQPMMLIDRAGNWVFYQITNYQGGTSCSGPSGASCTDPVSGLVVPCLEVVANPAVTLNAPGGPIALTPPVTLIAGLQYTALRVCDGWLEQKAGFFNPATDSNCPALAAGAAFPTFAEMVALSPQPGWSPLLPNVEDLQFAYLFADGTVGNGPAGTMTQAPGPPLGLQVPVGVPIMGPTPLDPRDVRRVIGIRVTVTARSSTPVFGGGKALMRQPAAEDHDPGAVSPDTYFRYQLSSTSLLRNRDAGF
jgi:type II secretory pathway pseudopilin PulG